MSEDIKAKKIDDGLGFILQPLLQESANEIHGPRVQINKDLADSLVLNKSFLDTIDTERKKYFQKTIMTWDDEVEIKEYVEYDFEERESFNNPHAEKLLSEEVNTGINNIVRKILKKFLLPTNFYNWVFYAVDTGKIRKGYPLYDLDVLAKIDANIKFNSGITAHEKKVFKNYLDQKKKSKYLSKKEYLFYKNKLLSLPRNVYRKKRVLDEVKKYKVESEKFYEYQDGNKKSLHRKTSSIIAGDIFDKEIIVVKDEDKAIKKIANRLRKRKSIYNRIKKK